LFRKEAKVLITQKTETDTPLHFVDENIATLHAAMMFSRRNLWNEIFIKKIDQLIDSGVVQKLEKERNAVVKYDRENQQEPEVLTIDHIGIGFVAVLICLGVSCIVFVLELIVHRFAC
jgi:hypothetical protein